MAPHTFTNETYVELLLLYFRNGENQSKASQLYAEFIQINQFLLTKILKTNKIHPYKTRFEQELLDRDPFLNFFDSVTEIMEQNVLVKQ
uniref:Uncharacterized protein n=1 Tax=Strigamia maritima TaxID=126957 RepID=T1JFG9_STRMM